MAQAQGSPEKKAPQGNILIVDDDPVIVSLIEKFLTAEGFRVQAYTDPEEALKNELPFDPEVILMDVQMPNISGFEMTKMLKSGFRSREIRIIMLTAMKRREDMEKAKAAGADDFLSKPVSRGELVSRIRKQLRILRSEEAVRRARKILNARDAAAAEKTGALVEMLRELQLI